MENFIYQSPTKIVFGKDAEKECGREIKIYGKKILLHYGGGSIKKSGLYDIVIESLKNENIEIYELGGVKPNPTLSMVYEGIKICKENDIEAILAVGGGSVIDSAKAIALGATHKNDVWDFFSGKDVPSNGALPVGVILTIPASGSETSVSTVITNEKTIEKISYRNQINRPVFALMNPVLTYTIPMYNTCAGIVDIFSHTMERYFTNAEDVNFTSELCEATMRSIIEVAPHILKNPQDYGSRAEIMWIATISHNGILETGRIADWASHKIEHELSAFYDVTHGAGLSIIIPAWMKYVYRHDLNQFVRFANKVCNIKNIGSKEEIALKGIEYIKNFFKSLGMPTSFEEANLPSDKIDIMAKKATKTGPVGQFVKLYDGDVLEIYKLAL